jgi:hypothetical protein
MASCLSALRKERSPAGRQAADAAPRRGKSSSAFTQVLVQYQ